MSAKMMSPGGGNPADPPMPPNPDEGPVRPDNPLDLPENDETDIPMPTPEPAPVKEPIDDKLNPPAYVDQPVDNN